MQTRPDSAAPRMVAGTACFAGPLPTSTASREARSRRCRSRMRWIRRSATTIACQAEVEATTAALKLQDKLPQIRARSLLGVVAKLEIIVGADRDIDDPTDFPWPHIASVLDDLKEIAGSLPLERPERTVVQADCRLYQEKATGLVRLEKQASDLVFGGAPVVGISSAIEVRRSTVFVQPTRLSANAGFSLRQVCTGVSDQGEVCPNSTPCYPFLRAPIVANSLVSRILEHDPASIRTTA